MAQSLIESLHRETRRVLENGLEIEAEEVPLFWTSCLLSTDADVRVAAYINPGSWWNKPYGQANVAVQKDKVREGVRISRVFVVDCDAELERVQKSALDQHRAGLSVGFIRRAEIDGDPVLSNHCEKAGSYDVALIGSDWAVVHHLNLDADAERYRDTLKLLLTSDPDRREAVRSYLLLLEEAAHSFDFQSDRSTS